MDLPEPQDDWEPVFNSVLNLIRNQFYKLKEEEQKGHKKKTMEQVIECF